MLNIFYIIIIVIKCAEKLKYKKKRFTFWSKVTRNKIKTKKI